jgi:hypothetical protein
MNEISWYLFYFVWFRILRKDFHFEGYWNIFLSKKYKSFCDGKISQIEWEKKVSSWQDYVSFFHLILRNLLYCRCLIGKSHVLVNVDIFGYCCQVISILHFFSGGKCRGGDQDVNIDVGIKWDYWLIFWCLTFW